MMTQKHYKYYWYTIVLKLIRQYRHIMKEKELSPIENSFIESVGAALQNISSRKDASARIKVINAFLDGRHNIDGIASKCYVCRRTATTYISEFVYEVGENMGFKRG